MAIIADFVGFGRDLQDIFDRVRAEDDGAVATYIPQLARVAPESYGAAVCTIENVHTVVGREPSGRGFNELALNKENRPHNPLINAGAIATCSLIRRGMTISDRFDHVTEQWQRLAGGAKPGFSNAVYLSEREKGDRNYALGYFMKEKRVFPEDTDLIQTLEFYFQCCSTSGPRSSIR